MEPEEANYQKWKGLCDRDRKLNIESLLMVGMDKKHVERIKVECPWVIENILEEKSYLFEGFNKFTDYLSIAETFLKEHPIHYDKNKMWWVWNPQKYKWENVDETDLLNAIDEKTRSPSTNSGVKHEILEALKRKGRLNKPKDANDSWVQFQERIIDLESGTEFLADPNFFITNPIDIKLGNSQGTPMIDKLFVEWVGEEHKEELYEIIAFCLVPSYFINRMFCLIGAGANGKSTYLKILEKFIGEENLTSSSLGLLLKGRFEGGKLYKKLVCLMGETSFNLLSDTDFLKRLSGQDLIRIEFKGKDCFDFRNYAKLVMSTNSLPPTADKTEGFYRRWHIIKFDNKFPKEKDVLKEIPEEEYENLAFKCLEIIKKLWISRKFTNEGDFEFRRRRYEEESNPLSRFIKENYEREVNSEVIFSEFTEDFGVFLQNQGHRTLSIRTISNLLKNEGFDTKNLNLEIDGKKTTAKHILGLKSKNNTDNTDNIHDCISSPHGETSEYIGIIDTIGIIYEWMAKKDQNVIILKNGKIQELCLKSGKSYQKTDFGDDFSEILAILQENGVIEKVAKKSPENQQKTPKIEEKTTPQNSTKKAGENPQKSWKF